MQTLAGSTRLKRYRWDAHRGAGCRKLSAEPNRPQRLCDHCFVTPQCPQPCQSPARCRHRGPAPHARYALRIWPQITVNGIFGTPLRNMRADGEVATWTPFTMRRRYRRGSGLLPTRTCSRDVGKRQHNMARIAYGFAIAWSLTIRMGHVECPAALIDTCQIISKICLRSRLQVDGGWGSGGKVVLPEVDR